MTKIRKRGTSTMVQDRRGAGGGGGLGLPIPGGVGMAGGGLVGLLVLVAAIVLPQLLGGGGLPSGVGLTPGAPAGVTDELAACETELEQVLCGAVEDVQAYWAATFPTAFGQQYQPAQTVFFSGATTTGCGQASARTGPFYCPLDSLVYFDLDFLVQLQRQFGAQGDLAAQYIVAHEYGHHVQNLLGINAQVRRAQQNDPSRANQYSVALELQADCFAGAWVRNVADRKMLDDPDEVAEALNAAAAVGDDRIQEQTQGRSDPETFTHGTSQQRQDWFTRGYRTGDPNRCTTFDEIL
jgi:predicted metalloprotease